MEHFKLDGCINTFSGGKLNLIEPQVENINIFDVARGLAFKGHFAGQTPRFFSIAQHSLMVCDLMEEEHGDNPELMLTALLHDASEAYIGDMVKPLKVFLFKFQEVENKLQDVIFETFNLDGSLMPTVKIYDKISQDVEYKAFYKREGDVEYLSPDESYRLFLDRYYKYLAMSLKEKYEATL